MVSYKLIIYLLNLTLFFSNRIIGVKRVDGSALQVYDNVTVTVFDEDGKEIDSVWFDCYENPRGGVVTLDTPGSTAEFYVRFTVKHTDCKFSFNGSITKV